VTIDRRLSEVLSEFARTLVTDFPIQAILDHLVLRIVDMLPVGAAGVTLISVGTGPQFISASDDAALRFERLQSELNEGPCIAAFESGRAVAVPDLREDGRFPTFASRALSEGLTAVFTFPLRHDDHQLGALDLYRSTPGELNVEEMMAAQTLADVATAYLLNAQARADLRDSSERAQQIALHDPLTGLPNRVLLMERLEHAISRSGRSHRVVAILFADLDHFKSINDTYGHRVGDQVLQAVAERLGRLLRPDDTLARLSGDEFAIICEDLEDPSQIEPLGTRIDGAFAEAFDIGGNELFLSASVGIAFASRVGEIPERLLQEADTAMYQAKRRGGGRHGTVDLTDQQDARRLVSLTHDLRGVLLRDELHLEYQPIVSVSDGRIAGVEALLRWNHPLFGMVKPEMVIAAAERSGLMADIGRWVIAQACVDRHRWERPDLDEDLSICINASAYQLMAQDFAGTVAKVLEDTGTDPKRLTIEVTESVFIKDDERALRVLNELKALGVLLALDDFGTGYSSLSYLRQFPVDIVKIDRAFVNDLSHGANGSVIVDAIIRLAHGLGMSVVAEGVETASQYEAIAALGCDSYQGYFCARPATVADLTTVMAAREPGHSADSKSLHMRVS
jgi:diguanylate cyclase (GGDEF)-like protein